MGLTFASKDFASVKKSVSHLPIRSVRFMQVEPLSSGAFVSPNVTVNGVSGMDTTLAALIYTEAQALIAMLPRDALAKLLIQEAITQLNTVSRTVELLRTEMKSLAGQLPEYPVVMSMYGVGDSLGPQLMAEIGDLTRFAHKGSLTAFAGVDPGANQSGTYEAKSTRTSKHGSPELRKALFLVMDVLIKNAPPDDPVFRFIDKKHAEGKPYFVYMTAGANKFLRIYYGKVKEYLASLDAAE